MYWRSNSATTSPFFSVDPGFTTFWSTRLKSPPPPPPVEEKSEPDVEPNPSLPSDEDAAAAEPEPEPLVADVDVPGVRGVLKRLVAARKPDDMFGVPLAFPLLDAALAFPPCFACTEVVGLDPPPEELLSRPNPERLPRSWGLTSDTNVSAPVAPLRRRIRSTLPVETTAVRNETVFAVAGAAAERCQYSAPATTEPRTTISVSQSQIRRCRGF